MKVLFLAEQRTKSGINGIAKNVLNRCLEFNKRKISYIFLYNAKDDFYQICINKNINIQYVNFPSKEIGESIKLLKIIKIKNFIFNLIKTEKITNIHVHNPYLLRFLNKKWDIPISCHQHAAFNEIQKYNILPLSIAKIKGVIKKFYEDNFVYNYKKADIIINVSYAAKNTSENTYKISAKKNAVILNGAPKVDIEKYRDIRKELGYKKTDKIIISVGRITEAKGVVDFCKVAQKFYNKDQSFKFVFIGPYNNREFYDKIFKEFSKYVNFLGLRNDIFDLYKTADLFLFLSHREACPNVAIEAMNFGLPIIGWNVTGVNEIVKNGESGYICKYLDYPCVHEKIKIFFENKKISKELQKNSLKRFQYYTIERNVDEFLSALKSIQK